MFHKIKDLHALDDFVLDVTFDDGKRTHYDIKSLIVEYPMFAEMKDNESLFKKASVDVGGYGIVWNDDLDLSAEEVYANGTPITE